MHSCVPGTTCIQLYNNYNLSCTFVRRFFRVQVTYSLVTFLVPVVKWLYSFLRLLASLPTALVANKINHVTYCFQHISKKQTHLVIAYCFQHIRQK